VPFAQDKDILAYPSRVLDIQVHETAVKKGHDGDCHRKCAAHMDTTINGLVTLFQRRYPDIRILDFEKLGETNFQQLVI
jgi:hypothetical protein